MIDTEIERRFAALEAQMIDERKARMQTSSDVTRLMTVVFGNPDLRIKGMADKLDDIAAGMAPLVDWVTAQRRFLGFFGIRDLPALVGLVLGLIALARYLGVGVK